MQVDWFAWGTMLYRLVSWQKILSPCLPLRQFQRISYGARYRSIIDTAHLALAASHSAEEEVLFLDAESLMI